MGRPTNLTPVTAAARSDSGLDRPFIMQDIADKATTPRISKGYARGQKRFREPLESAHHFGRMEQLVARQEDLARFTLSPLMRGVQKAWSNAYTQAFYTDSSNAKASKLLAAELDALIAAALVARKSLTLKLAKETA